MSSITNAYRLDRRKRWAVTGLALMLFIIIAGCAASPPRQGAADFGRAEEAVISVEPMEMESAESPSASPVEMTRKVISNAHAELVVEDTQVAVDRINAIMDDVDGYVSQANLYRDTYGGRNLLRGNLTLRIPAKSLEPVMAQLETMAIEVRSKSIDRQDVTDQYSDIEAQLRNLEATENELRELLAEVRARPNAKSEDILAVHRDLTQIRGEIEQLQGRKNVMDDRISMSTLELMLIPDAANRPVVEGRWEPGTVVKDATRALVSSLQFLGSAAIWIGVYVLPILLLMLIPLVVLIVIVRAIVVRRRRRRANRSEVVD